MCMIGFCDMAYIDETFGAYMKRSLTSINDNRLVVLMLAFPLQSVFAVC